MKTSLYSAAFCFAALIGFWGCSSDLEIPEPVNPAVGTLSGEASPSELSDLSPTMTGPSSIELDQIYTFTATSPDSEDTFTFTVKDTYFNDPTSYRVDVSASGTRIYVVFNEYGHYTITAKSNLTGKECSYEVAKYYTAVRELKYCTQNAPTLETAPSTRRFQRWFERYANYNPLRNEFSGRMTNFEERIVVNVIEKIYRYCYPSNNPPYIEEGEDSGTITGIAAKGDNVITLPMPQIIRHPSYHQWLLPDVWHVPYCVDRAYTIPEERCGAL